MSHPHSRASNKINRAWRGWDVSDAFFRIGRIVSVALLFFLFYLLMHAMVEHRFFRGGEMGPNGHSQQ